jgi:hypothetical protein
MGVQMTCKEVNLTWLQSTSVTYFQAWVTNCPLLGDKSYDGGGLAIQLRDNGFYLCSNRVSLEHPFYNTPQGKSEWAAMRETMLGEKECGNVKVTEEEDGSVWIHCKIDLPAKFHNFCASAT